MEKKTILITGITGFLGRNLILSLINEYNIIGIYHSESKFALFKRSNDISNCIFYKSDISNIDEFNKLLNKIFSLYHINYVIHSAAMKHVDICEQNIMLAINTNLFSSNALVDKCRLEKIDNLIGITTDKSIEPCNVYGYSKLLMQKIIFNNNYNCYQGANFFWSDGSVLDIWMDQMKFNLPLTITSLDHIRYYNYIGHVSNLIKLNLNNNKNIILPDYVLKISNKVLFEAFKKYFNYHNHKFIEFSNEKDIEVLDENIVNIYELDLNQTIKLIDLCFKNKSYDEYIKFENEIF
jgi:UDP-N-acetylglucosamine 4,6-dehydratase/5-epimerase